MQLYLSISSATSPWPWWPEAVEEVARCMARDGGHDWAHLARVHHNAHRIWLRASHALDDANPDDLARTWRIIAAAALFHDIVNLPKDSPDRKLASTRSGEHARRWLTAHADFSPQEAERVFLAIRAHSFSAGFPADTIEAQVLADADRLDALGAIGIARTFHVGGALDRALFDPADPMARHRTPDDGLYTVDHFFCKLLKLKEMFHTKPGLELAEARHETMLAFLRALDDEAALS